MSEGFGWRDAAPPHNHDYIAPAAIGILGRLGVRRVLDLGCGNGAMCREMCDHGYEVVGCEPDRGGFEIARQGEPRAVFHQLGVEDDPTVLGEAGFDAVVSFEVIEVLSRPGALVRLASRVLKPRGWLIVSSAYHGYLKNLALALAGGWDRHHTVWWDHGQIKFWSRRTLTQLLEAEGFEVMEFHGVGRVRWLWKSMILVARRRT